MVEIGVLSLFAGALILCIGYDISILIALVFGFFLFFGYGLYKKHTAKEMAALADCVQQGRDPAQVPELEKHAAWLETLQARYPNLKEDTDAILKQEMGKVFAAILENAGVFKRTPAGQKAFCKFIAACNA